MRVRGGRSNTSFWGSGVHRSTAIAAALASYAKQADDETLFKTAMRIKGRAVRRVGELLRAVEPKRGANQNIRGGEPPKVETRTSIAAAAGLSPDQAKEALRVASIPKREFERAIEAAEPPTVAPDAMTPACRSKTLDDEPAPAHPFG